MDEEPIVMPRKEARNMAIYVMHEAGYSYPVIARAFNLSWQRVQTLYLDRKHEIKGYTNKGYGDTKPQVSEPL